MTKEEIRAMWVNKLHTALQDVEKGPSPAQLDDAPELSFWRPYISQHGCPLLVGFVMGHVRLHDGWIRTSQLIALNSIQGWARTASRWYRLGQTLSELEESLAESFEIKSASNIYAEHNVPGFRPLDDTEALSLLLSAWHDRINREFKETKQNG